MPIFEYACSQCGQSFELLVFSTNKTSEVTCPSCSSNQVRKKLSTFASKVSGGSDAFSSGASLGSSCSTGSV